LIVRTREFFVRIKQYLARRDKKDAYPFIGVKLLSYAAQAVFLLGKLSAGMTAAMLLLLAAHVALLWGFAKGFAFPKYIFGVEMFVSGLGGLVFVVVPGEAPAWARLFLLAYGVFFTLGAFKTFRAQVSREA
jgi:hypothetical protein